VRVIVCGGRDYTDRESVFKALRKLRDKAVAEDGLLQLISGGCPTGADALAREFAKTEKSVLIYLEPADWEAYGKAAGPIRNKLMLEKYDPQGVVAFPGGTGTADMVTQAGENGVKVWFPCGEPTK
jgi:predicted Rossmann-fold nucleotide-binding protein